MTEHPFAQYIRLLARGKTKSRDLTLEEAEAAWAMIMADEVEPEQLGAFLMLMRLKEETAEEVAGFVRGARQAIHIPDGAPAVDLDWSSYAGKRRQLPWFVLAAMVLVQNGVKVFMHGTDGHTPDRIYTGATMKALGVAMAGSIEEAAESIRTCGFAYLPLEKLSPRMEQIIGMKPILGLRSPAHTICRLLNPFAAPNLLQGIFHPSFMPIHQKSMRLLEQPNAMVFRGEGGEIERRPNKALEVRTVRGGVDGEDNWPALLPDPQQRIDEEMDLSRLAAVWRGDDDGSYAHAAITGTLAVALRLLGRAASIEDAEAEAQRLWASRGRELRPGAK